MTYKLKKQFTISSSHRLLNQNWLDEKNKDVFGKCNNAPSHGHNYDIILYLQADKLQEDGMIKNFYELKDIFKVYIDNVYDHHFLNDCPGFENIVPSAENMCKVFYDILKPYINELYAIEIYETRGASAIYEEDNRDD